MTCIKTGCHAYVEPYGEYIYGDAFEIERMPEGSDRGWVIIYYFRICQRSREPILPTLHFTIHDYEDWFDKDKTSQTQNSTLISDTVKWHGYDGKPIEP